MKSTFSTRMLHVIFVCAFIFPSALAFATADSLFLTFGAAPFSTFTNGDTATFECSAMPLLSADDVVATGGCGGDVSIGFSESVSIPTDPIAAGHLSVMTCNFEGTDPCGNIAQLTINIRVQDNTAPVLQDVPSDLSLPVGRAIPSPSPVYAIDNCSRNIEVKLSELESSSTSYKRIIRTWSATDEAGNSTSASQQITLALATTGDGCGTDLFSELERNIQATDCENGTEVCLPFSIDDGALMLVNRSPVNYFSCAADTIVTYEVADLLAEDGAYEIIWNVSPGAYRFRTGSLDSLVAFMQQEQPGGDWKLDASRSLVLGTPNPRYAALQVIHAATGQQASSDPVLDVRSAQSTIVLMPGKHQLMYRREECVDTASIEVACATVRERNITAIRGIEATHTLPFSGKATEYEISIVEDDLAGMLEIRSLEGPKVNFTTMVSGRAALLIDLCHLPTGSCERYQLRFEIVNREDVKPPSAARDLYAVAYNGQRMFHILSNDEIVGDVSALTLKSTIEGTAHVDEQHRLHYSAPKDWCGEETLLYEVCNPGGCDTATVVIQVTCEDLMVFNGFSPNQDGINDHFTVIGIENYPANQLVVFNQHGHQVYSKVAYNNDWDGTFNGTPLLDGTYYYVLTIKGKETKSGYVQIKR